jgi:cell division protein FtsW (lipid II flippase)
MSLVLSIILAIYLIIGLIYALWIFFFGYDRWYNFPINWLFGLPALVMMIYFVVAGKKNPLGRL